MILAPAMIDIHGDAFERQLMPRPGVMIPLEAALLDTDRQLAANGIGTAYHALTLSWEPGLRSVATGTAVLAALQDRPFEFDPAFPVTDLDAPGFVAKMEGRARRAVMEPEAFAALYRDIWQRRPDVPGVIAQVAAAGRAAGAPMLSHDDSRPQPATGSAPMAPGSANSR